MEVVECQPVPSAAKPLCCYVSCAERDAALRDELLDALAAWGRERNARLWHRGLIQAGADRNEEVAAEIAKADLLLLLLSSSHAADGAAQSEMDSALGRHMRGEAWVIPILARPFLWSSTPVRGMKVLPSDGRAVTSWPNRDEAWLDVAAGIDEAARARDGLPAAPPRGEGARFEGIAAQLAADAGVAGLGPAAVSGEGRPSAFAWEAWVFERCAAGEAAALARLAEAVRDPALAGRLREMAGHVRAGKWPPEMAPTLLRVERSSAGWQAEVHIGFLGQVCSVALRPGARVPLGAGASLESEEHEGEVVVRLLARPGSALRGTRARIQAGMRAFSRWLVPASSGALGAADSPESTLFEMSLSNEREEEEEPCDAVS